MTSKPLNVLFPCTGNSGRPIMAEALLNAMGQGRYRACNELQRRVSLVVALPLDKLDRETLRQRLTDIGRREAS